MPLSAVYLFWGNGSSVWNVTSVHSGHGFWGLRGGPFDFWRGGEGVIMKNNILQAYLYQKNSRRKSMFTKKTYHAHTPPEKKNS